MNERVVGRWHPPLRFFFLLQLFFLPYQQLLFSSLFLISNGFLSTFTGACIVLGALSSHRKTNSVTHSTITTDIHQTLNVQLDFRTEITLHFVLSTNDLTNLGSLVIGPVFHFQASIYASLIQYFCRTTATYPINIGQRNFTPLILRQIDTNYSYSHILNYFFAKIIILSLTLFILRIFLVNNIQTAITSNDFTFWRTFF